MFILHMKIINAFTEKIKFKFNTGIIYTHLKRFLQYIFFHNYMKILIKVVAFMLMKQALLSITKYKSIGSVGDLSN